MVPRQQSCPFRIDYPGRPFNDRFPGLIKLSSPRAAVPACSPDAAPQNGGDEPVAGAGVCFQVKSLYPSWSAPWLRLLLPGAPGARSAAESGCIPLSGQLGGWSRGCPVFSPDRCFFWEPSPPPRSVGLGLRPPMPLFTMILEEGVESSAADGGSGAARVAERVAALRLSGVAAFCISKCALSAGALGRNCHLLPHCQPRRGYASFADSQPPALITRSTPSLEPPGQSRHIPSRCCTAGRRAGAGASMQSPSLHPSLPAGIAPPLRVQLRATARVCSGIPLLARLAWFWGATGFCSWAIHANPPPCAHPCPWESPKSFSPGCLLQLPTLTPPMMVLGCSRGQWGLSGQAHGTADPPCRRRAGGAPGCHPSRHCPAEGCWLPRTLPASQELPRSIPGARPPRAQPSPAPLGGSAGWDERRAKSVS